MSDDIHTITMGWGEGCKWLGELFTYVRQKKSCDEDDFKELETLNKAIQDCIDEFNNTGSIVQTYEFKTTEELDAFIYGLEEASGWLEDTSIDNEELTILKELKIVNSD